MLKYAPFCRICMEDSGELISPCRCSGSLEYIHEECLKTWLQSKRSLENAECEICHTVFSMRVVIRSECVPRQALKEGLAHCLFMPLLGAVLGILSLVIYILGSRIQEGFKSTAQEAYAIGLMIACVCSVFIILIMAVGAIREACIAENLKEWVIYSQNFEIEDNTKLNDKTLLLSNEQQNVNNARDNS